MSPIYKEAEFPADYREAQVGQVMRALYKQRSITISGLAGMGKSNLVRFIVSHPHVRARYLKERADAYAFVHVDCAGLASGDEAEILQEIAIQMGREGLLAGAAQPAQVPGSMRRVLKEHILSLEANLNLVLVLDYFDEAVATLDKSFYNYLFHVRNARPKANLSIILAARRPPGFLYELQELFDDDCLVGPLGDKDALESLRRDEARLGCRFDAAQRRQLMACTGGHPGFLKNAAELLASREIDGNSPLEELARQLLQAGKVRRLCQELWEDLTPPEQKVLLDVARGLPRPAAIDGARVAYLEQSGLLVRGAGQAAAIFCPLFAAFVAGLAAAAPGVVRISAVFPNQARIQSAAGEQRITLSPKLLALLQALAQTPGEVLPTDQLIGQVYGDEAAGVTNAALSQLVKRLRGALDGPIQRLTGDPSYISVETVRDVGYKLRAG